jgi:hypothetical protein
MMTLDDEELVKQLNNWAKQYNLIPHKEWVSMDGKALKNTVENYSNSQQNFIRVVSALSSRSSSLKQNPGRSHPSIVILPVQF